MKGFLPIIVVASSDASGIQKGSASYYCNGSADDYEINAALALAESQGGGLVFLTAGNFYLNNTIKIGNNTILQGSGQNTKLQFDPSIGDLTMITNNCGYTPGDRHGTGNLNITLKDMLIDGDKDARGAGADAIWTVGFNTVENLLIENITVLNGWTAGIRTEFCTYVTIRHNYVDNSGDDNIAINEETAYATVFDNTCLNAGLNKSYGSPAGIEIQDTAHDVAALANTIIAPDNAGIEVSSHAGHSPCYNVTISSNLIRNAQFHVDIKGLSTGSQFNVTISNNVLTSNSATYNYPIQLSYTKNVTVTGNVIQTLSNPMYVYNQNTNLTISANTFHYPGATPNGQSGLKFKDVLTDVRFANNVVSNFGWKGIELSGTITNMHIIGNHVTDCMYATGACIWWSNPTSSRCRLDANYLRGTHWSYDQATTTYDVMAAGWTEAWNEKHI